MYIIAAAAGGGGAALCLALLGVYCYRRRKGKATRERAPSGRHDDEDVKPPPTRSTSPSSQKSSPVAERPPEGAERGPPSRSTFDFESRKGATEYV